MSVWTRKSGELAASSSRDFERLALPLLRIFWPDLIHPRGLSGLDRAGIDLVEWSDTGHFPVVVQCKGLYEEELLVSKQLSQIRKSITSFLNSKFSCETYILLHNRTGEERDAHSTILGYLNDLKTKGKAKKVELWDRQEFLKRVKRQLKSVIAARISEGARLKIATQKQFFRYGSIHIDPVPVSIERWRFGATGGIKRDHESPERISPSDMLATTEKYKWTLLIGHFGLGKSTFALHAATTFSNNLIYVHSSELPDLSGGVGTNSLMQKILQSTPLFQDFDDVTASEFERLGSTLLRETLSNTQKGFALIIDGLDESERYSSARGLVQLTNELEELRCKIVLVTRKEHFDATFGNFDAALSTMSVNDLSIKGGKRRMAQICCINEWTDTEVSAFFNACLEDSTEPEKLHIQPLIAALDSGVIEQTFGSLTRHPLFLQMMAEVASEGDSIPDNPAELITAWTRHKIRRDLVSGRKQPWPISDIGAFVEEMIELMEDLAVMLTTQTDSEIILKDEIDSVDLRHFLANQGYASVDLSDFINVSLLVPVKRRQGREIRIRFYHRVLQEYFLARKWRVTELPKHTPDEILFWQEALGSQE